METAIMYPKNCRRNIHKIVDAIGASVETAYAMMLMTSTLMDLRPEDDDVTRIILKDCGVDPDVD